MGRVRTQLIRNGKIIVPLRRQCIDCEDMFYPTGKFQKYCQKCLNNRGFQLYKHKKLKGGGKC